MSFFPCVKLCWKLLDLQAGLRILQPKPSNVHLISICSNLDLVSTTGYLKCLIVDPIGWAHTLHKRLWGLAGFQGKLRPKIMLRMNHSSLHSDSLPKMPGKGSVWKMEREFNHTKKCSLVHLGTGNNFKTIIFKIIQKQISSTGIVLNNNIGLT